MRKLIPIIAAIALAASQAMASDPPELKRLKNLSHSEIQSEISQVSALRPKAIEETAYALGVQHGVKWRYDRINSLLEECAGRIDKIYNFNAHLLYNGTLMPPIVVEAGPGQRLENDKLSVYTDATYKIIADARLLTTVPEWRGYLMQHYDAVIDVHPSLYPKAPAERKIWQSAIEKGWNVGVDQADYIFEQSLNRLNRDVAIFAHPPKW